MPSGRVSALSTLTAFLAVLLPAGAQSVISTHAGVIHFFEGNVYLGDQPLESHLGKYSTIPQGAELRTADGRAEVLLTPGVFLRMGGQTTIRLVANDLADTQVELRTGSVVVDSGEPNPDTSVTLIYKDWRVHFVQKGVYRIDADPPRLSIQQGQAEVSSGAGREPVLVEQGMTLPFAGVLIAERTSAPDTLEPNALEPRRDALNQWSAGRSDSIAADNAITAQIDQDPASQTADPYGFTYFPMLGVSSVASFGSSVVPYSSYPTQPGFNSIYLPGYTYRPTILSLMGLGTIRGRPGVYLPSRPRIGGITPGTGVYVPGRSPYYPVRPFPHPAPVRGVAPVGVRGGMHAGGGHR